MDLSADELPNSHAYEHKQEVGRAEWPQSVTPKKSTRRLVDLIAEKKAEVRTEEKPDVDPWTLLDEAVKVEKADSRVAEIERDLEDQDFDPWAVREQAVAAAAGFAVQPTFAETRKKRSDSLNEERMLPLTNQESYYATQIDEGYDTATPYYASSEAIGEERFEDDGYSDDDDEDEDERQWEDPYDDY